MPAEGVDCGGGHLESLGCNVVGSLVKVGGFVEVSGGIALGERMADGEIDEESWLPEQTPAIDIDLWTWGGWCGELRDDLFAAGLITCALSGTAADAD